jgi:hypothetical protein
MTSVGRGSTIERTLVYLLGFLAVCIAVGLGAYSVRMSLVSDIAASGLSETLEPGLALLLRATELIAIYCAALSAIVALGMGVRVWRSHQPCDPDT